MKQRSRHSLRIVRTQRSAWAFALGACTGVRITSIPFAAEDLVKAAAELAVAIMDQEAKGSVRIVERHEEVSRLLRHPDAIRVARGCHELDRRRSSEMKNRT